jgi:purine-binding chemotaxis protein CheW
VGVTNVPYPPDAQQTSGAPPGEGPSTDVLVLRLEAREYALPVHRVIEVVRMVAITPLPEAPPWVDGVVNLRGRVVPVIDLRARLGIPRRVPDLSTPIVMTVAESGAFGLVADELVEVLTLSPEGPDAGSEEAASSTAVTATARHGDRLILMLDADRLHDRSVDALLPTGSAPGTVESELP